jgi:flagellar biosynthetic protein FlhB
MTTPRDRRTERPTARRLRRARDEGRIARSPDIGQAASLGAFLLWAALSGAAFLAGVSSYLSAALRTAGRPPGEGVLVDSLVHAATLALRLMLPLLLALAVAGLLAQLLQGARLRKRVPTLDFARLSPALGFRRLQGAEPLRAAGTTLLRLAGYALIAAAVVLPEWNGIAQLALSSPGGVLAGTIRVLGRALVRALALGLVIAAADYALARWRWYRDLSMTRQEVMDERRETEGSPEVRSRVRARLRALARRRMTTP